MLEFADAPYQFIPPKPNPLVISLIRSANRLIAMPSKNHRLAGVELGGTENFAKAADESDARFVFLPNHPTHSDPHVITEMCRLLGVEPAFMTAYDVFARGKLGAWCMQHNGAFSVDREGSDRKSMKCAAEIIGAGDYPLVIFPEGNVYFCNDKVTPFNEGAAYIALRAQQKLRDEAPVFTVPVSLKYTFVEDVRQKVRDDLDQIAREFNTTLQRDRPIIDEIRRISLTALASHLQKHGHMPADDTAEIDEQIQGAVEQIIVALEEKIALQARAGDDLTARVRKIRTAIHRVRTEPEQEIDQQTAARWAEEAMLALRILGYAGSYAASNPTLDRVAEAVARLREDVASRHFAPFGRRLALVHIEEPIDLRTRLDAFAAKARDAVGDLTREFERRVQAGLDRLNESNSAPGGEPF